MADALLSLRDVDRRFDAGLLALHGVSLQVDAGEFVALLGPSGCGKSTVLRLLAGLDHPTRGQVHAPAREHGRAAAETAFVFQDPTLMPWADVFDNVWLPLRLAGQSRAAARPRVEQALAAVGLAEFAHRPPLTLSGGMKMRVSVARALVTQPRVLLMDEPFAALDEITRQKLNVDLLASWQARRFAAVFVTHSVFEAVFLAQRVLVMSARPGRIVAERRIDAPVPRPDGWRMSATYATACRELSQALEAAHAGGAA